MPRNLELKARVRDLAAAREIARRVATEQLGAMRQRDTYFHAPHGRLKLREIEPIDPPGPPRAELIGYRRADRLEVRPSDYFLVETESPWELARLLEQVLGRSVVVEKVREAWLHHQVRIHLDLVHGLGTFLEFEAVLSSRHEEAEGRARLMALVDAFGLTPDTFLESSYGDLLLEHGGRTA